MGAASGRLPNARTSGTPAVRSTESAQVVELAVVPFPDVGLHPGVESRPALNSKRLAMARYAPLISTCVPARPTRSASYGLPDAASAGGAVRSMPPAMRWGL